MEGKVHQSSRPLRTLQLPCHMDEPQNHLLLRNRLREKNIGAQEVGCDCLFWIRGGRLSVDSIPVRRRNNFTIFFLLKNAVRRHDPNERRLPYRSQ